MCVFIGRCLHAIMDPKNYHNVTIFSTNKFENFGDMIRKGIMVKMCIKGDSHFNISLCFEINVDKNDVIVFLSTFVTCNCQSHNHYLYKRIKKYFF
jgi:hypothetical protein